uniref:CW-type domain-containing protein n=1 Tax=Chromera velia CCMP2878 TaxID=1169474 RepID=A0A0G4HR34_9ALVE|eukprot:Cvel_8036.t1-p1 / transcript=Cvel_8036.t1 / gene=Cvel_8036 / organism=Chromera_velia_CCMP2878 / gene_product=hypothetical protein / transcript_product=hypothetical protein / location=Cvel_scaffold434:53337-64536(-) / protein_length=2908 / sequence_SO=supercontig / SO=protein_coding / is_pseudo=false
MTSGQRTDAVPDQEVADWVECSRCKKWRRWFFTDTVPETWVCEQNVDIRHNSCDIEEQEEGIADKEFETFLWVTEVLNRLKQSGLTPKELDTPQGPPLPWENRFWNVAKHIFVKFETVAPIPPPIKSYLSQSLGAGRSSGVSRAGRQPTRAAPKPGGTSRPARPLHESSRAAGSSAAPKARPPAFESASTFRPPPAGGNVIPNVAIRVAPHSSVSASPASKAAPSPHHIHQRQGGAGLQQDVPDDHLGAEADWLSFEGSEGGLGMAQEVAAASAPLPHPGAMAHLPAATSFGYGPFMNMHAPRYPPTATMPRRAILSQPPHSHAPIFTQALMGEASPGTTPKGEDSTLHRSEGSLHGGYGGGRGGGQIRGPGPSPLNSGRAMLPHQGLSAKPTPGMAGKQPGGPQQQQQTTNRIGFPLMHAPSPTSSPSAAAAAATPEGGQTETGAASAPSAFFPSMHQGQGQGDDGGVTPPVDDAVAAVLPPHANLPLTEDYNVWAGMAHPAFGTPQGWLGGLDVGRGNGGMYTQGTSGSPFFRHPHPQHVPINTGMPQARPVHIAQGGKPRRDSGAAARVPVGRGPPRGAGGGLPPSAGGGTSPSPSLGPERSISAQSGLSQQTEGRRGQPVERERSAAFLGGLPGGGVGGAAASGTVRSSLEKLEIEYSDQVPSRPVLDRVVAFPYEGAMPSFIGLLKGRQVLFASKEWAERLKLTQASDGQFELVYVPPVSDQKRKQQQKQKEKEERERVQEDRERAKREMFQAGAVGAAASSASASSSAAEGSPPPQESSASSSSSSAEPGVEGGGAPREESGEKAAKNEGEDSPTGRIKIEGDETAKKTEDPSQRAAVAPSSAASSCPPSPSPPDSSSANAGPEPEGASAAASGAAVAAASGVEKGSGLREDGTGGEKEGEQTQEREDGQEEDEMVQVGVNALPQPDGTVLFEPLMQHRDAEPPDRFRIPANHPAAIYTFPDPHLYSGHSGNAVARIGKSPTKKPQKGGQQKGAKERGKKRKAADREDSAVGEKDGRQNGQGAEVKTKTEDEEAQKEGGEEKDASDVVEETSKKPPTGAPEGGERSRTEGGRSAETAAADGGDTSMVDVGDDSAEGKDTGRGDEGVEGTAAVAVREGALEGAEDRDGEGGKGRLEIIRSDFDPMQWINRVPWYRNYLRWKRGEGRTDEDTVFAKFEFESYPVASPEVESLLSAERSPDAPPEEPFIPPLRQEASTFKERLRTIRDAFAERAERGRKATFLSGAQEMSPSASSPPSQPQAQQQSKRQVEREREREKAQQRRAQREAERESERERERAAAESGDGLNGTGGTSRAAMETLEGFLRQKAGSIRSSVLENPHERDAGAGDGRSPVEGRGGTGRKKDKRGRPLKRVMDLSDAETQQGDAGGDGPSPEALLDPEPSSPFYREYHTTVEGGVSLPFLRVFAVEADARGESSEDVLSGYCHRLEERQDRLRAQAAEKEAADKKAEAVRQEEERVRKNREKKEAEEQEKQAKELRKQKREEKKRKQQEDLIEKQRQQLERLQREHQRKMSAAESAPASSASALASGLALSGADRMSSSSVADQKKETADRPPLSSPQASPAARPLMPQEDGGGEPKHVPLERLQEDDGPGTADEPMGGEKGLFDDEEEEREGSGEAKEEQEDEQEKEEEERGKGKGKKGRPSAAAGDTKNKKKEGAQSPSPSPSRGGKRVVSSSVADSSVSPKAKGPPGPSGKKRGRAETAPELPPPESPRKEKGKEKKKEGKRNAAEDIPEDAESENPSASSSSSSASASAAPPASAVKEKAKGKEKSDELEKDEKRGVKRSRESKAQEGASTPSKEEQEEERKTKKPAKGKPQKTEKKRGREEKEPKTADKASADRGKSDDDEEEKSAAAPPPSPKPSVSRSDSRKASAQPGPSEKKKRGRLKNRRGSGSSSSEAEKEADNEASASASAAPATPQLPPAGPKFPELSPLSSPSSADSDEEDEEGDKGGKRKGRKPSGVKDVKSSVSPPKEKAKETKSRKKQKASAEEEDEEDKEQREKSRGSQQRKGKEANEHAKEKSRSRKAEAESSKKREQVRGGKGKRKSTSPAPPSPASPPPPKSPPLEKITPSASPASLRALGLSPIQEDEDEPDEEDGEAGPSEQLPPAAAEVAAVDEKKDKKKKEKKDKVHKKKKDKHSHDTTPPSAPIASPQLESVSKKPRKEKEKEKRKSTSASSSKASGEAFLASHPKAEEKASDGAADDDDEALPQKKRPQPRKTSDEAKKGKKEDAEAPDDFLLPQKKRRAVALPKATETAPPAAQTASAFSSGFTQPSLAPAASVAAVPPARPFLSSHLSPGGSPDAAAMPPPFNRLMQQQGNGSQSPQHIRPPQAPVGFTNGPPQGRHALANQHPHRPAPLSVHSAGQQQQQGALPPSPGRSISFPAPVVIRPPASPERSFSARLPVGLDAQARGAGVASGGVTGSPQRQHAGSSPPKSPGLSRGHLGDPFLPQQSGVGRELPPPGALSAAAAGARETTHPSLLSPISAISEAKSSVSRISRRPDSSPGLTFARHPPETGPLTGSEGMSVPPPPFPNTFASAPSRGWGVGPEMGGRSGTAELRTSPTSHSRIASPPRSSGFAPAPSGFTSGPPPAVGRPGPSSERARDRDIEASNAGALVERDRDRGGVRMSDLDSPQSSNALSRQQSLRGNALQPMGWDRDRERGGVRGGNEKGRERDRDIERERDRDRLSPPPSWAAERNRGGPPASLQRGFSRRSSSPSPRGRMDPAGGSSALLDHVGPVGGRRSAQNWGLEEGELPDSERRPARPPREMPPVGRVPERPQRERDRDLEWGGGAGAGGWGDRDRERDWERERDRDRGPAPRPGSREGEREPRRLPPPPPVLLLPGGASAPIHSPVASQSSSQQPSRLSREDSWAGGRRGTSR